MQVFSGIRLRTIAFLEENLPGGYGSEWATVNAGGRSPFTFLTMRGVIPNQSRLRLRSVEIRHPGPSAADLPAKSLSGSSLTIEILIIIVITLHAKYLAHLCKMLETQFHALLTLRFTLG